MPSRKTAKQHSICALCQKDDYYSFDLCCVRMQHPVINREGRIVQHELLTLFFKVMLPHSAIYSGLMTELTTTMEYVVELCPSCLLELGKCGRPSPEPQ